MKDSRKSKFALRTTLLALAVAAATLQPTTAPAASVALATSPLATSTTSTVKPNVMFVLDDSGSMTWSFMPDAANNFHGKTGYHSNHCNGVYYNPDIAYVAPLDASGASYADATFTAAFDNGFDSSSTTSDLNSDFYANRFSPESANSSYSSWNSYTSAPLGPYAAQYFNYSGAETVKKHNDATSNYYIECNTAFGNIPGNGSNVFTRISLSSSATATKATIVVAGSNSTAISGIKVNGMQEIMAGTSVADASSSNVAINIATEINLCTAAQVGNCTTAGGHGYTASPSGSTITLTGLATSAKTLIITKGNAGTMTLLPTIFPAADAAQLKNFANWYSFYRTRMQMMKTASGHAFSTLDNSYRIGLMQISASTSPLVVLDTFETTHRSDWYSSLYNVAPSGSTPLRTALSNAGRYYAGQLGGTDPIQYSCQQNFTILSTDGYWNDGTNPKQVNGSTDIGNQDNTAARPMFDGSILEDTWTNTYTQNSYTTTTSGCSGGKKKLKTQPKKGTCTVTTAGASCTPGSWSNNGSATLGSCVSSITVPSPNPSAKVLQGSAQNSSGGSSNSLADVAMYYYQTDLRTTALGNCTGVVSGEDVCVNNVFTSSTDNSTQQHMTTFTLGLGADGRMKYSSSYLSDTDTTSDFHAVDLPATADGASICSWQANGTVCNWPIPSSGSVANIDDLWHAAVNGRGAYFSATDPSTLSSGLSNALSGINARKGAAAAAATSTLNPVAGNNFAFVASYTTVKWKGNLEARGINVDTGSVNENAAWCIEDVGAGSCPAPGAVVADTSGSTTAYFCVIPGSVTCPNGTLVGTDCRVPVATACTGSLKSRVTDLNDTRNIKTANSTGTGFIDFTYANLTATQKTYFEAAHISSLNQWTGLSTTQKGVAAGANLVNFLRGQNGYEDRTTNSVPDRLYRYRESVLGDALESQPAFMAASVFSYPYPGYSAYLTAQAGRAGTVYMGANDGMMHAFASSSGTERWAYVPSMVIQNLWKLADTNYATLHTNFVNGSPVTSDVCTAYCTDTTNAVWKTILVAGLNGGGRGYYALDITDPANPALLWELTTTAGIGAVQDDDIGYSFGHPIITRKADGTWVVVVSSGYNNTSPGNGKGYLYVLNAGTGAIISKISTNVGNATTPSGLAHLAGWNNEPTGNQVGYVYGGDLLGNVWRFDINSSVVATVADGEIGNGDVLKFATLFSDAAGTTPQPITTTPTLGKINEKRVIFIGTGKYLETSDLTTTQVQSIYAIKDDDAASTLVNPRNSLANQTLSNNPDGTATRLSSGNAVNFFTGRGWYVDLPDSGERVNIDSKLVQGTLLVPTIVPSNTVCSPGGYGWLNYLDYKTGGAINVTTHLSSAKYDATIVGINVLYVQGEPKVGVVTSTNPTPELSNAVQFSANSAGFTGKRVIWRELMP